MIKKLALLGAFSLFSVSACKQDTTSYSAPAKFNFGTVLLGDSVRRKIPIVNTGDKIIKILKVETSCQCIATHYSEKVSPGDTGFVDIKFKGLSRGLNEQLVMIETNAIPVIHEVVINSYVK